MCLVKWRKILVFIFSFLAESVETFCRTLGFGEPRLGNATLVNEININFERKIA